MPTRHTDREYEAELEALREKLLLMAGRVEEMIRRSVEAVCTRDGELGQKTILMDRKVNRAEREVDEMCLLILAKRHPMASDLRFVTLALKMVTDLERIGDLAVNVCERAVELSGEPQLGATPDIQRIAVIVQSMIKDAIDAFVQGDADKARAVIDRDDEVDELYHSVFRLLLDVMRRDEAAIAPGIHVQSVAKFLERIGDHATNLAEQVIFMVRGTDVRHEGKLADALD